MLGRIRCHRGTRSSASRVWNKCCLSTLPRSLAGERSVAGLIRILPYGLAKAGGAIVSSRCLSSPASDPGGDSCDDTRDNKGRRYLERWAGIRGGVGARPTGVAAQAPTTAPISTPAASFYGRTYLLSTVRVPPFPPISSTGEAGLLGGATPHLDGGRPEAERLKEEEEEVVEERRAFESMRDALQGTAALGTTGFYPRTGSPVVLDLGAVSQDGSPHGRPAGRASLAGAARAVRAAGLVPVGVCNTSHDVLKLALEHGLPEVMMVQARLRASPQSSTPPTASTPRTPPRRRLRENSSELSSQNSWPPSESAESLPIRVSDDTTAAEVQAEGAPIAEAVDHSSVAKGDDFIGLQGANQEEDIAKETMMYQGSVRSGQQVYAEGTSLVIIGAVSSGGEVMADGDIHVYGTLRGRALAGLSGNKSAKIFATRFDAELVGVGDIFTTCHDPDSLPGLVVDAPTNVSLRENELVFSSFDLSSGVL